MARKSTKVTAPEAELVVEVQAAEATVVNPFAALVEPTVTAAPTAHAVMLAKAQAVGNMVTVAGVQLQAANNVAARHASLNAALPVSMAQTTYVVGRAPKLRVGYTQANWPAVAQATDAGPATAQQIKDAGATTDFIRYAVKSGWLVAA